MDLARAFDRPFGLNSVAQDLSVRFEDWRARRAIFRRTYDELQALSDRDLADLGLHRSEIGSVARDAARGA